MSHQPRLMIPALGAAVAALALVGCQKTDDGQTARDRAGQTMERTKDAAKGAADTTAAKTSDATITAKVNTALAKDPDLSALKIDVDTSNGHVVLSGKAPNPAAKERATQIAQAVSGVVSVDNKLVVG